MAVTKRATEEKSKSVAGKLSGKASGSKTATMPMVTKSANPEQPVSLGKVRAVANPRKPSKTALSPAEVTPLVQFAPSKPARRRRSGAAKPRKLKGATATWPFPTGSRP